MPCLKLHTFMKLAFAMLACIGCTAEVPERRVDELAESVAAVECQTEEDVRRVVAHAGTSHRAVLFIHVDWAVMAPQRRLIAEFAAHYHQVLPGSDLLFHYVDCSPVTHDYAPLRELDGWKELEDAAGGGSLIGGAGELVWMHRGRVLHVESIIGFKSSSSFVQKTKDIFSQR